MNNYQTYIATSRYSRWLDKENRRETWYETVNRYKEYFYSRLPEDEIDKYKQEFLEAISAIKNLEIAPSMRSLMTAGAALERDNIAGYNCAYAVVDDFRIFDEAMYILMAGTGLGFSVERQYIAKLPELPDEFHSTETVIHVSDSRIGWASAFRELISLLSVGKIPRWDLSKIRPAGARLRTFGGRASGPDPLNELFEYTVRLFLGASGRRLRSIECHDLMCKVASIVVAGGVRRSALISLSNLSDHRMAAAKQGQWWVESGERALANNSAAYTEKPDLESFMREWKNIYDSKSGERGIINRVAFQQQAAKNGRRDAGYDFGCNPCSEIILRPNQVCNLTEVVVRATDTFADLKRKVRLASILGTLQSTLTDFRYLRKIWQRNIEEERLLGVSLTGIMDHPVLNGSVKYWTQDNPEDYGHMGVYELSDVLGELKNVVVETNKEWAAKLGIPQSTATTCIKPSGTVSQLVDSSSGIHARYAPFYIRRVRNDIKDPLCQFMINSGIPAEVDVTNPNTMVFSFPQKAPEGAVFEGERTAIESLELFKLYQDHWCEHKPSITIHYKDDEYMDIGAWIWKNWDSVTGISLLPKTDHIYKQAPYEEITKEAYESLVASMPSEIDWDKLGEFEKEDTTTGSREFACTGTYCEVVDNVQ